MRVFQRNRSTSYAIRNWNRFLENKRTGLDYPSTTVGSTTHVTVMLASSLKGVASNQAQQMLNNVEAVYQTLQSYFSGLSLPSMIVVIAPLSTTNDGTGGAYHYTCSDSTLYVDVDIKNTDGVNRMLSLFMAEAVEVAEALQGLGWNCGSTNGEGLSRVLAESLYGSLSDFETASAWLDGTRPNWVDTNEATDTDGVSNGCAVMFINWLKWKGYSYAQISAAGASTLAGTYGKLTGHSSAWADFMADVNKYWKLGSPSNVTTDNPWALLPAPIPTPTPTPTPTPGCVVKQLLKRIFQ